MLERTLVLLKPSTIQRALIGEIINRFEKKGLRIAGMKMMQLDDAILEEHYAHLVKKPFFPSLKASMMKTPVIAMCLEGVDGQPEQRSDGQNSEENQQSICGGHA